MRWQNLGLVFEREQRLALLTVNRPEKRNALDGPTVAELHRALDEIAEAGSTVLIVTGAGEKSFVAGADIASIRERRRDDALAGINSRLMTAVEAHPAVSIAAVNGWALGGGCELALACDLRIAAEHAVFGLPETTLGITGARWDAAKALEAGLVSRVVPGPELLDAARELAGRVLALGPLAVRLAKQAVNASAQMPLAAGLAFESTAQAISFESKDKLEGTSAFLEKRPPRFTGE
jgi:enoyl-CoA hydratase